MFDLPKKRIPIVVGTLIEIAGILFGTYLVFIGPSVAVLFLRFLLYLVAWVCLLFFSHSLTHYVVGRVVGVRFQYYSLGKSSVYKLKAPLLSKMASRSVVFTLNIDRASLRSVSYAGRMAMYASGAIASMVLPFLVAFASLGHLPIVFNSFLFLLSVANLVFDAYYSPKAGDISRALASRK